MNNIFYKDDPEYPELLRQIEKEAPKQLYYKGEWHKEIFENCLAVVGSRRLTSYGQRVAQELIGKLALSGMTIVSGFMYGGDAAAHQAAVKVGCRTIAVMPCGIERIHPEYQKKLYDEILENKGLIISEYKGDMPPVLWTYPQRNRIIAGISKAVLVLEAGKESGSLITANYAKKFKRKIFAVPGPIISSVSAGTNLLIKQGAEIVTSAQDVLEYFYQDGYSHSGKIEAVPSKIYGPYKGRIFKARPHNKLEKKIVDALEREPLGIDELSRNLEILIPELSAKLSFMQIKGVISQQGNKYYVN